MRRSTIPHHLQTDAADLRRFRARATVINRRQRRKTAKLATVLAAAASMLALAGCQDTMLVAHARAWIFEHRYVGPEAMRSAIWRSRPENISTRRSLGLQTRQDQALSPSAQDGATRTRTQLSDSVTCFARSKSARRDATLPASLLLPRHGLASVCRRPLSMGREKPIAFIGRIDYLSKDS
jgi:hypothetical protein